MSQHIVTCRLIAMEWVCKTRFRGGGFLEIILLWGNMSMHMGAVDQQASPLIWLHYMTGNPDSSIHLEVRIVPAESPVGRR
jgi:hypothetical protein